MNIFFIKTDFIRMCNEVLSKNEWRKDRGRRLKKFRGPAEEPM
jgi:hypothetical protein